MNFKEKFKVMLNIHTRVVTGIFFVLCVYLFWIPGYSTIRIIDILGIQLIGLVSAVAELLFLVEKEYSKSMLALLNTAYFLVINSVVLIAGYKLEWFSFQFKKSVIAMEIMIIVVYAVTKIIFYLIDYTDAAKLNKKIQERNKEN